MANAHAIEAGGGGEVEGVPDYLNISRRFEEVVSGFVLYRFLHESNSVVTECALSQGGVQSDR